MRTVLHWLGPSSPLGPMASAFLSTPIAAIFGVLLASYILVPLLRLFTP